MVTRSTNISGGLPVQTWSASPGAAGIMTKDIGQRANSLWPWEFALCHPESSILRRCGQREDVDPPSALVELDLALDQRVDGPITADADVLAGMPLGPTLAADDAA